jgi:hypothetical protein
MGSPNESLIKNTTSGSLAGPAFINPTSWPLFLLLPGEPLECGDLSPLS